MNARAAGGNRVVIGPMGRSGPSRVLADAGRWVGAAWWLVAFVVVIASTVAAAAGPQLARSKRISTEVGREEGEGENDPHADPASLYFGAVSHANERRIAAARRSFREMIAKHPDHPLTRRARLNLAQMLIADRELDEAVKLLDPIVKDPALSETREARLLLLDTLAELGRFRVAMEQTQRWHEAEPQVGEWVRQLARFHRQLGQIDEARLLLTRELERTGDSGVFSDLLAMAVKRGAVKDLIKSLTDAKSRYDPEAWLEFVSEAHAADGSLEAALTVLADPRVESSAMLLKKRAHYQLRLGRFEPALASFRRLGELMPGDWETVRAIGHCELRLGRKAAALATWRGVLERGGMNQNRVTEVADVMIENQLHQEALDLFNEARRQLFSTSLFAEERATVLNSLGRKAEALDEFLLALAHGGFKTQVFDAIVRLSDGQLDVVEKRLRTWLDRDASQAIRQALIEVYLRLDDPARIPELLAIDGDRQHAFVGLLLARLREAVRTRPSPFLRELLLRLLRSVPHGSLPYDVALALLELPHTRPVEAIETIGLVVPVLVREPVPDRSMQQQIWVGLARLAFETLRQPELTRWCLQRLLAADDTGPVPPDFALDTPVEIEARRLWQQLLTAEGDFAGAAAHWQRLASDAADRLDVDAAQILTGGAELAAHRRQYPEALGALRRVIDDHADSLWVNDALALGLLLTNGSTGTLEPLDLFLAGVRHARIGQAASASAVLGRLIASHSESPLRFDAHCVLLGLARDRALAGELAEPAGIWRALGLPAEVASDPAAIRSLPATWVPVLRLDALRGAGGPGPTGVASGAIAVSPAPPVDASREAAIRAVLGRIEAVIGEFKAHPRVCDLLLMKIDLLQALSGAGAVADRRAAMKLFVERYPGRQEARRLALELGER